MLGQGHAGRSVPFRRLGTSAHTGGERRKEVACPFPASLGVAGRLVCVPWLLPTCHCCAAGCVRNPLRICSDCEVQVQLTARSRAWPQMAE